MSGVVNIQPQQETFRYSHSSGSYGLMDISISVGYSSRDISGGIILGQHVFAGGYDYVEDGSYNAEDIYVDYRFKDISNRIEQ